MTMNDIRPSAQPLKYKRRLRNYLLDTKLQLKYTGAIVVVGALLTGVLGYKMYQATRDTSRVIEVTALADPATASLLQDQFAANDRTVLWGIVAFGVLLSILVTGMGILITHKVAGPLFKISTMFARIRDGRIGPPIRDLRRGDELVEFHNAFREMHEALRQREVDDVGVITAALGRLEQAGAGATKEADELRRILRRKESSLEGSLLTPGPVTPGPV